MGMPKKTATKIKVKESGIEGMRFMELKTFLHDGGQMTKEIGRAGKFIAPVEHGYWLYEQFDFLVGRWVGSYRIAHLGDIQEWTLFANDDDLAVDLKNHATPMNVT